MNSVHDPSPHHPERRSRIIPPAFAIVIGVVGAVIGLLPWLVTGAVMPLQNIWNTAAEPSDMPMSLLPMSQYYLVATVSLIAVGATIAGVAVRWFKVRGRNVRRRWAVVGVVVVQAAALIQATLALHSGLEESQRAQIYLWGLVAGVATGIVIGLLVLMALASHSVVSVTWGVTFAALAFTEWLPLMVLGSLSSGSTTPYVLTHITLGASAWIPILVAGGVIGWCGIATIRRGLTSFIALLALWVVPAVVTAFQSALGSRINLHHPDELWPTGLRVFVEVLVSADSATRVLVACVVAVLVAISLRTLRRGFTTPSVVAAS